MLAVSSCFAASFPDISLAPPPLPAPIPLYRLPEDRLLPDSSLIEISGPQAHLQAARILASNRKLPAAWVEQKLESLPEEVLKTPINFDKVLFVDGQRDSTWAVSALLRSKQFPIVVYSAPYENEKFLRRLRFQARACGASVLLLRPEPCFSWTIRVQLSAHDGCLDVLRWRKQ